MAWIRSAVFHLALTIAFLSPTRAIAQCPTLIWSDEFNGDAVDTTKWSYQTGGGGWGNNELQYYRPENATVANGILTITARQEDFGGRNYTSTRIRTMGKADFVYGRFEACIKMTATQGIWPAFWMMPTESVHGGWPRSGEIDIMENLGNEPAVTHGTIHYGDPNHKFTGTSFQLPGDQRFADDFHVFAVEKEPHEIRWYVDDVLFFTRTPDDISPEFWPFEESFHFILNVAVGGNWPGNPDQTTVFPQTLEVDYVRVYDMGFPTISGDRDVTHKAANRTYSVTNAPADSHYVWSVPSGARIVSGQGTHQVTVDWGETGGVVQARFNNHCGFSKVEMDVHVNPPFSRQFSLENFDQPSEATLVSRSGTLTEIDNPHSSLLNGSAIVGQYQRNPAQQYDTLIYDTNAITHGEAYVSGEKRFYLDVFSTAPPGSVVLFQLENKNTATGSNYPVGRHSRYQAVTTIQNGWERLELKYLDQPDSGTGDQNINRLVLLFQPNSFSSDTWIFDNLDGYGSGGELGQPPAAPHDLVAQSAGASQIHLTWADAAENEAGFEIARSMNGVVFNSIHRTGQNASSFTDTGLESGLVHHYRVRALNDHGPSSWTQTATAVTQAVSEENYMLVASLVAGTQRTGEGARYGTVVATVTDRQGQPLVGVLVTGQFSGSYHETASAMTDHQGSAIIQTAEKIQGLSSYTFCVTNVVREDLVWRSEANIITCDTH